MFKSKTKIAIIVSHPIQYYAPLYRRLAQRDDLILKVFFTWHAGEMAVEDRGFKERVAWDIPLTEGYEFELVPNVSFDQGTHHFLGLNNPTLVKRVTAWQPDAVHITGWAWLSHALAMRAFHRRGTPVLFRGDSHLLNESQAGVRWWIKHALLRRIFSWATAFLVVGKANLAYYEAFGVESDRLHPCPHSIDVLRFAEPARVLEEKAAEWRQQLGVTPDQIVLLFAGKFEKGKRPIELMRAVHATVDRRLVLMMVGGGELEAEVRAAANMDPDRFRVLPFQNQSQMPLVYRLGDLFVLPSFGETWGLAVNEALACGRPVLVSDRVGCAIDVVDATCGKVFTWADPSSLSRTLQEMTRGRRALLEMGQAAARRAWCFDIERTEAALMASLSQICTL